MNKFFKKLAVLLSFVMVFTAMPMGVFAAETTVAKIGEESFTTLANAVAAAKEADGVETIELLTDVTLDGVLTIQTPVTIAGNGKRVIGNVDDGYSISVEGTSVTFNNLTVEGKPVQFYKSTGHLENVKVESSTKYLCLNVNASKVTFNNFDGNGKMVNVSWGSNITGATESSFSGQNISNVSSIYSSASDLTNAAAASADIKVDVDGYYKAYYDGQTVYSQGTPVVQVGSQKYLTFDAAVKDAANGGTVTLLTDVTLDATLALENTITIDGAGYKLISADTTKTYSSVVMAGNSGWGDPAETSPKITLKNLDISGWTTSEGVVRAQGVTLEVEGCTFKNNTVTTAAYGVVSVNYANGIVKNSKFENNTGKAIDANYNVGDSTATTAVIEGCTFTGNTSAYTGIVVRNDGTKFTVKNSTFTNNTVNTAGNAATLYSGWGTEDEISGCTFTGNTVTSTSANAKRFASAIFCDGCKVNGNKFQNNTATLDGSAHSTTVAVGGYYGPSDISGNYWGGAEPVKDVDYTANYTYETVANDNYYSDAELTNLVCICNMDELVTVPEVKATCTTDGTKTHEKCETCGKLYVDGAVVAAESLVIPATGHAFGEWVVDEAAGVKTRTCKNGCGETETAKLPVTEEAETLPNNVQTEVKLPDVVEEDTPVEVETVVQVSKDEETKEEATEALEATAATVVSTIVAAKDDTTKTNAEVATDLGLEKDPDAANTPEEFVEFVQDNATNEEGGVLLTITKEPVVEKMENVPEADKAKITVAEGAAVEYLDIKVKITATANGESVTALVSELDKPMPITFAYPADWNEGVKEGMVRKFILKFVHDGVAGEVEAKDNGNNTVTAYVDQFSTYALTYVDVPATHDHVWGYNTTFDAAAHWDYCHVCGAQNTPVAHSDADGNGLCDCGWNFAATANRANPNTGVTADMLK